MSGYAADALVDFTGGVAERLEGKNFTTDNEEGKEKLFQTLLQANDNKALLICTKEVSVYIDLQRVPRILYFVPCLATFLPRYWFFSQ